MVGNIKSIISNHVLVLIDVRTFNDVLKISYILRTESEKKLTTRENHRTSTVVFYVKNDHLTVWFIWFLNKNEITKYCLVCTPYCRDFVCAVCMNVYGNCMHISVLS